MPPCGTRSTLITVAPTGAETAKADVPALPVTLDELVATAKACEAAGAGLVHVHIRDDDAPPHARPRPAARHRRRRCASRPPWSSSCPPAAAVTDPLDAPAARSWTPSPTPAR